MKHIIILGDGMADHPVDRLGGLTLLQYANTPNMDALAAQGRTGILSTIPAGFHPGSEVANTSILGYDLTQVYEGRGPLEAASIGYEMEPDDMAMRCNIITLSDTAIVNHHGGHLSSEEGARMISFLNQKLGSDRVRFIPGVQYRQLLVIKGGSKHLKCYPPHDHPGEPWRQCLVEPMPGMEDLVEDNRLTPRQTADLINSLILKSQEALKEYYATCNPQPNQQGKMPTANSIWPWGGGYRPHMLPLAQMYPQIKSGAVISAVDLIRGIGHYAGLDIVKVEGATGQHDTNYHGKVEAAIKCLKDTDFVFLHIEASDEAGHDGDLGLKIKTIENLDKLVVGPIVREVSAWDLPVRIAVLPDHPTPVEVRTHVDEPVPFLIWQKGIAGDGVATFDEVACASGSFGHLHLQEFMQAFINE